MKIQSYILMKSLYFDRVLIYERATIRIPGSFQNHNYNVKFVFNSPVKQSPQHVIYKQEIVLKLIEWSIHRKI